MALVIPFLTAPTLIVAHSYSPFHALLFGVLSGISWAIAAKQTFKNACLGELVAASTALIGITGLAITQGLLDSLTTSGMYALVLIQIVFTAITMVVGPFVVMG